MAGQLLEVVTDRADAPVEIIAGVPGVEDVQPFGDRAHVRFVHRRAGGRDARHRGRPAAPRGSAASSIRPIAASLEDVFIDLITGHRT